MHYNAYNAIMALTVLFRKLIFSLFGEKLNALVG